MHFRRPPNRPPQTPVMFTLKVRKCTFINTWGKDETMPSLAPAYSFMPEIFSRGSLHSPEILKGKDVFIASLFPCLLLGPLMTFSGLWQLKDQYLLLGSILKTGNILWTQLSTEEKGEDIYLNTMSFNKMICGQPIYFSNNIWIILHFLFTY